ncbi:hypothetical protein LTR53_010857 [Teratosphaeriaceae sp. CCFEE 6253]|nr:hypothetical protein LTR53_010857 [Teratosphaeriaceae sp. CCFEE 6253]
MSRALPRIKYIALGLANALILTLLCSRAWVTYMYMRSAGYDAGTNTFSAGNKDDDGPMKVYLIRHGETVDNVAGLYAGVRDSALTIHGVEQARRLGEHFAKTGVKLTHIFASPLSRAFKTAEALQKAQSSGGEGENGEVEIVKVPDLIEQDFGFYEGKSFFVRSEAKKSGKDAHRDVHKDDPGFVDVETKESMCKRADAFLDEHLAPLLEAENAEGCLEVAVVSHGMLLGNLWRRLLLRLPKKSLAIAPEVTAVRGTVMLEHLGGWSNTGYLELAMSKDHSEEEAPSVVRDAASPTQESNASADHVSSSPQAARRELEEWMRTSPSLSKSGAIAEFSRSEARRLTGWSTTILAIDSKAHLVGLKRQRGGIGRLAHDEGQQKLDGFFKRQKKS